MAFKIVRNDITKVRADIIVNSANTKPICAGYRTDAAIYEAAGYDELLAARKKIGDIEVGHAEVTPAFNLPAKYIVHTVGPRWIDGNSGEPEALRSCYRESLSKAVALRARSIAFPLISTGAFKFPKDQALDIATEVAKEFTSEHKLDVILVVYDEESFGLTTDLADFVQAYIDEHYVGAVTENRRKKYAAMDCLGDELRPCHNACPSSVQHRNHHEKTGGVKLSDYEPIRIKDVENREEEILGFANGHVQRVKQVALEAPLMHSPTLRQKVFIASRTKFDEDLEEKLKDFEIQSLGQRIAHYLFEKKLDAATVYTAVFMDRRQFSKLLSDKTKLPHRETILALAIGMKLTVVETTDLMSHAGYSFNPNINLTDNIVAAYIEHGTYDVRKINMLLSIKNQSQLG